jgi:tetratricopeptide (TPR) repeat protein
MSGVPTYDLGARFVLRDPVGAGGMATVYRALDRHTGNTVAVKLLHAAAPMDLARFELEVSALAALDHPGVVRLLAHGRWPDGRLSLAMEWLDGEDLVTRLGRGSLEPREVVTLCQRIAEALAAVHARGIVHRDLKPANIFLPGGAVERAKLIDFGIARLSGRSALTGSNVVVGTPGYMAPEQARSDGDIDVRADIFALGSVMFECLTGRPPFVGEHALAVLAMILYEEVPAVNELCPDVAEPLASLVAQMMSKHREERPASAAVIVDALAAISRDAHAWPARTGSAASPARPTVHERRFFTVVLVHPPGAPHPLFAHATDEPTWPALREQLRNAVEPLGARVDALVNGVQVMTWKGAEDAPEQAARAARCALLVRERAPEAMIVLASGFSDAAEPRTVWGVLDGAASMLSEGDAPPPGPGIRVDSNTVGLLDPRFRVLKGALGWELVGEGETGTGARMLLGRPSPYVGRTHELRLLLDTAGMCVDERAPAVVLVTAPPGMGKSRLEHELRAKLDDRFSPENVWVGRGDSMSAGSAFAALGSVLRAAAGGRSHEPLSERRDKLAARVARAVPAPERARVAAFLGEIAGAPFPEDHCALLGPARANPSVMSARIRQAWLDFVSAECAAHPVLIVLDDLHWGDKPSVDLIDAALGELENQPLMVLALARPEVRDAFPDLWAKRGVHEIPLGRLRPQAAEDLVRRMLGASLDPSLVARIVARAEGNAFYLEEMIRAAADGQGEALPNTILAVVQARLDVLPAAERAALRAASVLGERFWPRGVEAVLEGTVHQAQVSSSLRSLLSKEILSASRLSRFPGEQELTFRHALLRDGAYALWAEPELRAAHLSAAEWLQEVGEDDPVMLAEHFEQSDAPDRAVHHRIVAAQRALSSNDFSTAIAHADRCRPELTSREARLLCVEVVTESAWMQGDLERAAAYSEELLANAPPGSDPWSTAIGIKLALGLNRGQPEEILGIVTTFMGTELVEHHSDKLARIYGVMASMLAFTGLRGPTRYFLDVAIQSAADDPPDPETQWFVCTARAQWCFFCEGDLVAAEGEHRRALAFCKEVEKRWFASFNHCMLSWIYNLLGAHSIAEDHARRVMAAPDARGHPGLIARIVLSWLLVHRGELAEGVEVATRVIEAAEGNIYMKGMAHGALVNALLAQGELTAAAREASSAIELLSSASPLLSYPIVQSAAIDVARGRPAAALAAVRTVLDDDGAAPPHPPILSYAWIVRIDALEALGDHRGARAALAEARRHVLATAERIDDPALRSSFLELSPWNPQLLARSAHVLGETDAPENRVRPSRVPRP